MQIGAFDDGMTGAVDIGDKDVSTFDCDRKNPTDYI